MSEKERYLATNTAIHKGVYLAITDLTSRLSQADLKSPEAINVKMMGEALIEMVNNFFGEASNFSKMTSPKVSHYNCYFN